MDVVMELCDHIVVMNFGEKLAEGTPEEIQNDPGRARRPTWERITSVLRIQNLNVYYGQIHALRDLSLEVEQGAHRVHGGRQRRRARPP